MNETRGGANSDLVVEMLPRNGPMSNSGEGLSDGLKSSAETNGRNHGRETQLVLATRLMQVLPVLTSLSTRLSLPGFWLSRAFRMSHSCQTWIMLTIMLGVSCLRPRGGIKKFAAKFS